MINSFYSNSELDKIGFKSIGDNVLISKKASFYNIQNISIGSNVRIDDFCIISGQISIGSFVHISAFVALYGKFGIEIGNFSGISPNSIIFSAVDDFSGNYYINPMLPVELTNVKGGKVLIKNHVQLGVNTIVMPDLTIEEGAVTGAFSFVNSSLKGWSINFGIPAIYRSERSRALLNLKQNFDLDA